MRIAAAPRMDSRNVQEDRNCDPADISMVHMQIKNNRW